MDKFVPKEPGWYWYQGSGDRKPFPIEVWKLGKLFIGSPPFNRPVESADGTFHPGPIQPPEEGR